MSCKRVIIVGNSSTILKKENGAKIDDFEYVVRMGDAPHIKGYEKYTGTRTDMFRIKWFNMFNTDKHTRNCTFGTPRKKLDFDIKQCDILCICQDPDWYKEISQTIHRYYDISLNRNFLLPIGNRFLHDFCIEYFSLNQKWYFFNSEDIAELMLKMNLLNYRTKTESINEKWIEPSGGLCTIWYFLKYTTYDVYITGFDGFRTCHYWKPSTITTFSSHSSIHERIFINTLIKKGVIHEL